MILLTEITFIFSLPSVTFCSEEHLESSVPEPIRTRQEVCSQTRYARHFLSVPRTKNHTGEFLLTLLTGVRFCRHLHVVGWQQAGDPAHLAFPPVRVGLVQDADQLTLGEAQLVLIGGRVVVHGDDLAHCGGESRRHVTSVSLVSLACLVQVVQVMLISNRGISLGNADIPNCWIIESPIPAVTCSLAPAVQC